MGTTTPGGPVELAVIELPSSQLTGDIVTALADVVERGIVTILDLVFVTPRLKPLRPVRA